MRPEDLTAFARRDWAALERAKADFWVERKRTMSPRETLELADDLRRHTLAMRPDWPDADDRAADIATHHRVSEALRATTRVRLR
jgi:hypothetical protein